MKKLQVGGEEGFDDLFTYQEGDKVTYFIPEAPEEQMHNIGPSGGAITASSKGKFATQGDESEDVEILETPKDRRLITEPRPVSRQLRRPMLRLVLLKLL